MPIKKPKTKKQKKAAVKEVMSEFQSGELNIGKSSKKVKKRSQALAIALSYTNPKKRKKRRTNKK